ncbi:MAG: zinc ribbon domain-containing protein [archaeon]
MDFTGISMFKKKEKCSCGRKVNSSFSFCPYCGASLRESIRIAKQKNDVFDRQVDDITKQLSEDFGIPLLSSFPFKAFVKKMSKNMEKQFREAEKDINDKQPILRDGHKIGDINQFKFPGGQGFSMQIKMGGKPQQLIEPLFEDKPKQRSFSKKDIEKFSKLPRKEPSTKVRRLTKKIVYELDLPGVKSEKDIILTKLENSIEIKAFSKNTAYFKLLPIPYPILGYKLKKQVLTIEFKI